MVMSIGKPEQMQISQDQIQSMHPSTGEAAGDRNNDEPQRIRERKPLPCYGQTRLTPSNLANVLEVRICNRQTENITGAIPQWTSEPLSESDAIDGRGNVYGVDAGPSERNYGK